MLLKVRFVADSIPSALTESFALKFLHHLDLKLSIEQVSRMKACDSMRGQGTINRKPDFRYSVSA
jgi:hypothetical protein